MDPSVWLARLPGWVRRPKAVVGLVVAAAALGAVAVFALRIPTGAAPQLTLPRAGAGTVAAGAGPVAGPGPGAGSTTPPAAGFATVHVAGAVVSPGIYTVPAGARVADAVTAAGGPLADAELDRLNLAARVADGDRVAVPRRGDPAAAADGPAGAGLTTVPAGPLDLNTATVEQLDTLPGVGPATAQAIVAYRTRHGRFRSVTELLEVPGIGPAKLEAVRSLVRV